MELYHFIVFYEKNEEMTKSFQRNIIYYKYNR